MPWGLLVQLSAAPAIVPATPGRPPYDVVITSPALEVELT